MRPLSKILVGVDLSESSDALIEFAQELGKNFGSEIVLFNSVEDTILEHAAAGFDPNAIINAHVEKAKEYLEKKIKYLEENGVAAYYVINDTPEDPAHAICKFAQQEHVSEILIGHKGKGIFKIFPIGSTALSVVGLSKVPVILVKFVEKKQKIKTYNRENTVISEFLQRVIIGIDNHMSKDMLEYFANLLKTAWKNTTGEVHIIHVIESDETEADAKKLVSQAKTILEAYGIEAKTYLLTGKPSKALIRASNQLSATSLLVGRTLKRKRLHEYITGTTLWRLMVYIDIPMVIYPLKSHEEE